MKKIVFEGNVNSFASDDFAKLMEKMRAEKIGERYIPYDDSGFCRRGMSELYTAYYLDSENVVAQYHWSSDCYLNSEIILRGTSEDISGVEKKVLEAIAAIKFDPEGFRIN